MKIILTDGQRSALECSGLDLDDGSPITTRCWNGKTVLAFEAGDRDGLYSELNDLSNAEDGTAQTTRDPVQRRQAAGAAAALGNLAGKVLRVGR